MKQKTILKTLLKKRAESLMETIIAITVIALIVTGAGIMVRISILGNELSQDRMTALNLAREGVEAMRNIRDTNWLRYAAKKDTCWNTLDDGGVPIDITNCDDVLNLIEHDTYYSLYMDLTDDFYEYYLKDTGAAGDVFDASYQMHVCEIYNPPATYTGSLFANVEDPAAAGCDEDSYFYRNVYFVYEDTGDPQTSSIITVTVNVGWYSGGEQKEVSLTEKIGNW